MPNEYNSRLHCIRNMLKSVQRTVIFQLLKIHIYIKFHASLLCIQKERCILCAVKDDKKNPLKLFNIINHLALFIKRKQHILSFC